MLKHLFNFLIRKNLSKKLPEKNKFTIFLKQNPASSHRESGHSSRQCALHSRLFAPSVCLHRRRTWATEAWPVGGTRKSEGRHQSGSETTATTASWQHWCSNWGCQEKGEQQTEFWSSFWHFGILFVLFFTKSWLFFILGCPHPFANSLCAENTTPWRCSCECPRARCILTNPEVLDAVQCPIVEASSIDQRKGKTFIEFNLLNYLTMTM